MPDVAFERREVPEEFPDGAYDLVVVSEVLYYLDEPAFDATLNAIERTLHGTLLAVHWRPFAERYPLTGDEVHARLRARFGEPAYTRQTDKYNLDRFDAMRLVIAGGGPGALATARAYREAGGDGDVTLITPEAALPYTRPALSKEFLRGEMTEDELAIEPPEWYAEHGVTVRTDLVTAVRDGEVVLRDETLRFDACVIATGATPKRPFRGRRMVAAQPRRRPRVCATRRTASRRRSSAPASSAARRRPRWPCAAWTSRSSPTRTSRTRPGSARRPGGASWAGSRSSA